MLFLRGIRQARIKTYQHHERQCEDCKDFNLAIGVYQDYFHFYFIPFVAAGVKSSVIICNSCGSRIRSNALSKEYESKTKIPFYLYTGAIIIALFVLFFVAVGVWSQLERPTQNSTPKIGGVIANPVLMYLL